MFAITGGGTGGHLAIAKALAIALEKTSHKAIYIGSQIGQDKAWFENSPLFVRCYFLDSTGVVNKRGLGKILALFKQFKGALYCKKILKSHHIQAVISVGGFSAGGGSIGAILGGIPLYIHEQNAIKGTLNALLTPFARAVFGSFASENKHFIRTAYPVREEFFSHQRVRENIRYVLFLGGSQGAKGINDFALIVAKDLLDSSIHIIHQCGERDYARVKAAYQNQGILESIELFSFESNLVSKIEKADVCVARSGASSVWELAANGLIALFVPYPYAAKDHQYHNGQYFAKEGLGLVVRENALNPQVFFAFLASLDSALESAFRAKNGSKDLTKTSQKTSQKMSQKMSQKIFIDNRESSADSNPLKAGDSHATNLAQESCVANPATARDSGSADFATVQDLSVANPTLSSQKPEQKNMQNLSIALESSVANPATVRDSSRADSINAPDSTLSRESLTQKSARLMGMITPNGANTIWEHIFRDLGMVF